MHRRADVHDTAFSMAPNAVAGLRMRCKAHRRPFHRWASTRRSTVPTAAHRRAVVHDIAARPLSGVPTGLPGVRWMAQAVPFHRSASVTMVPRARCTKPPTAVHAPAELQDTAASTAAAGRGVRWTAQAVPFHRSASAPRVSPPTAAHAIADAHDTPASEPPLPGSGTVRTVHFVPFHSSASGVVSSPSGTTAARPTAMHALADVHETSPSELRSFSVGVAWNTHVVPFHASASGSCASSAVR